VRLLVSGRYDVLLREMRKAGAAAWALPAAASVMNVAARAGDWQLLEALYDSYSEPVEDICYFAFGLPRSIDFAVALHRRGRAAEASRVIGCVRTRLAEQSKGNIRSPYFSNADLSFYNAQILSLHGNGPAALKALRRAVDLGWTGEWRELASYPALHRIRSSPEFPRIEARLNQRIALERQEVLRRQAAPAA
jgi:hypothetical protein